MKYKIFKLSVKDIKYLQRALKDQKKWRQQVKWDNGYEDRVNNLWRKEGLCGEYW